MSFSFTRLDRRSFLSRTLGTVAGAALFPASAALAQTDAPAQSQAEAPAPDPAREPSQGVPFSFDILTEKMRSLSQEAPQETQKIEGFAQDLTYDDFQKIRFQSARARWVTEQGDGFQLQAFHPGWLFNEPVRLHEVIGNEAHPLHFTTDDFDYRDLADRIPEHFALAGVAGFSDMPALQPAARIACTLR
mgnify:CR=1 FL=1